MSITNRTVNSEPHCAGICATNDSNVYWQCPFNSDRR